MSFALAGSLRPLFLPFCRTFQNRALLKPIPPPIGDISTPESFLKAIGRGCETKISFDTWDDLWKTNGLALKKAGLAVRDRRYILWAMEHYRQREEPSGYVHEAKPKKKIRGYISCFRKTMGLQYNSASVYGLGDANEVFVSMNKYYWVPDIYTDRLELRTHNTPLL